MNKIPIVAFICLSCGAGQGGVLQPYVGPSISGVDTSSLKGKVMTGYQGWFNCEGDGADLGWTHWARGRNGGYQFAPGNVTVDYWPDVSELGPNERFSTGFHHADGSHAEVFSSYNRDTVIRHFEWMRDYGIDGAFVQRFANGLTKEKMRAHKDVVLANAREGANRTGRSYAVMYDLSGLPKGGVSIIRTDWKILRTKMHVTEDPAYQHQNGKPLVAVWGIGFSDKIKPRKYTLAECRDLIGFFKEDGCSVMIGSPTGWRNLDRDSVADPALHEVIEMADVLSPWTVGRYRDLKGISRHAKNNWGPDIRWCAKRGVDYLPVVFPGFSWHHLKGEKLGAIPRLKGRFFWQQFFEAKKIGSEMLYVAMFDEVDEGTAIFKCSPEPPSADGVPFLTFEGLPSDYYLFLTGQGGKMLRGEIPLKNVIPDRNDDSQSFNDLQPYQP